MAWLCYKKKRQLVPKCAIKVQKDSCQENFEKKVKAHWEWRSYYVLECFSVCASSQVRLGTEFEAPSQRMLMIMCFKTGSWQKLVIMASALIEFFLNYTIIKHPILIYNMQVAGPIVSDAIWVVPPVVLDWVFGPLTGSFAVSDSVDFLTKEKYLVLHVLCGKQIMSNLMLSEVVNN